MSLSYDELQSFFADSRPFPEQERNPQSYKWRCQECGDFVEKTRRAFSETPRCRTCSSALRKAAHPTKKDWPFLNEMTLEYQEKVLRGEITQRDECEFECLAKKHSNYWQTPHRRAQSLGCPLCAKNRRQVKAALELVKRHPGQTSSYTLDFAERLSSRNISFTQEVVLGSYRYDFLVGDSLLEINPTSTHNSTNPIFGKEPKEKSYHLKKTQNAIAAGFKCIHWFEWEDRDKVLNLLYPKTKIYGRACQIEEISQKEANIFLKNYHLQGASKGQTVCIGLKYQGDLVGVMTFGEPRFNKHYDWELIRLCFSNVVVLGGSQKMFNFFVEQYDPENIISYCDFSKFSGSVYQKLGFTLQKHSAPSGHWTNKDNRHISDNSLRMRGFDILVGKQLGLDPFGKGSNNKELMQKYGYVQVFDCGQQTWVWN